MGDQCGNRAVWTSSFPFRSLWRVCGERSGQEHCGESSGEVNDCKRMLVQGYLCERYRHSPNADFRFYGRRWSMQFRTVRDQQARMGKGMHTRYWVVIAKGSWSKDIFVRTTDILPRAIFIFTVADGVYSLGCCVTSKHVWDNASICCYLAVTSKGCWSKDIFVSTTAILPMTIFICTFARGVRSFGCLLTCKPASGNASICCYLVEIPIYNVGPRISL